MQRRQDRAFRRLLISLAIALAVHLLGIAPALQWLVLDTEPPEDAPTPPPPVAPRWVEIHVRPPDQDPAFVSPPLLPTMPPREEPPEPEPPKPKPPELRPDGQVVEIPPPEREERPDDARFLSSHDSKVDREQVSRHRRAPQPRTRKSDRNALSAGDDADGQRAELSAADKDPTKSGPENPAERPGEPVPPNDRPGDPNAPQDRSRAAEPPRALLPEGGEYQRARAEAAAEARRQLGRGAPSGGGAGGGPPSLASLLPTLGPEDLELQHGSIDHITDADEGEATLLNTRAYKFAWYFNRVKNSVEQHWHPVQAHRARDPYGRIYGVRDRMTRVEVTLNADGTIDDLRLTEDSGVSFLDEVALQAFRDAQPFPNPPDGLQDPDGRIRFVCGFNLEISSGGLRLFRY